MVEVTQDKETLREAVARAYWSVALKNGLANDLRQWDERQWKDGEFDCFSPAVDSKTKALVLEAMDAAIATVFERLRTPQQEIIVDLAASLAAAISLLERGRKAAKNAAPSDKMFDLMVKDYKASLIRARKALTAFQQENSDER